MQHKLPKLALSPRKTYKYISRYRTLKLGKKHVKVSKVCGLTYKKYSSYIIIRRKRDSETLILVTEDGSKPPQTYTEKNKL